MADLLWQTAGRLPADCRQTAWRLPGDCLETAGIMEINGKVLDSGEALGRLWGCFLGRLREALGWLSWLSWLGCPGWLGWLGCPGLLGWLDELAGLVGQGGCCSVVV